MVFVLHVVAVEGYAILPIGILDNRPEGHEYENYYNNSSCNVSEANTRMLYCFQRRAGHSKYTNHRKVEPGIRDRHIKGNKLHMQAYPDKKPDGEEEKQGEQIVPPPI